MRERVEQNPRQRQHGVGDKDPAEIDLGDSAREKQTEQHVHHKAPQQRAAEDQVVSLRRDGKILQQTRLIRQPVGQHAGGVGRKSGLRYGLGCLEGGGEIPDLLRGHRGAAVETEFFAPTDLGAAVLTVHFLYSSLMRISSSRPSSTRTDAVCPGSGSLLTPSEVSQGSSTFSSGYLAPRTQTPLAVPEIFSREK